MPLQKMAELRWNGIQINNQSRRSALSFEGDVDRLFINYKDTEQTFLQ